MYNQHIVYANLNCSLMGDERLFDAVLFIFAHLSPVVVVRKSRTCLELFSSETTTFSDLTR